MEFAAYHIHPEKMARTTLYEVYNTGYGYFECKVNGLMIGHVRTIHKDKFLTCIYTSANPQVGYIKSFHKTRARAIFRVFEKHM